MGVAPPSDLAVAGLQPLFFWGLQINGRPRVSVGGRCQRRGQLASPPCRCRCPWPAPVALARSCPVRVPGQLSFLRTKPRLLTNLPSRGELILDDIQPSPDALADHGALKLAPVI